MILARSALREAIASGDLKIHDDTGNPFPGFKLRELGSVMAPSPNSIFDLTAPGIVVSNGLATENPKALEPASIDLHLGNHWLLPCPNTADPMTGNRPKYDSRKPVKYHEYFEDSWEIPGHGFILARTQEVVGLSGNLFAYVSGRSSFGRFGVFAENAGVIDPGFYGSITLELYNALPHPVVLYAGTPCCQLIVNSVLGSVESNYNGSYQGQLGTKGSMLYKTVPGGER